MSKHTSTPLPTPQDSFQQYQQYCQQTNKILWIILPIFAFLLSVVIANFNFISPFTTFIVLTFIFVMVGIKRKFLIACLIYVVLYSLVDNYISYEQQFNEIGLLRQGGSMLLFVSVVWYTRRTADRALKKRLGLDSNVHL